MGIMAIIGIILLAVWLIGIPAYLLRGMYKAMHKPKPTSVQMGRLEFSTSDRQVEPRGPFYEGCYRAMLREGTKKRIVR